MRVCVRVCVSVLLSVGLVGGTVAGAGGQPRATSGKPACNAVLRPIPPDGCVSDAELALPAGIPAPCISSAAVSPPDPLDAGEYTAILHITVEHPELGGVTEDVILAQESAGRWLPWKERWNSDCGLNEAPLAAATAEALNRRSLAAFSGYTTPLLPDFLELIAQLAGIETHQVFIPLVLSND